MTVVTWRTEAALLKAVADIRFAAEMDGDDSYANGLDAGQTWYEQNVVNHDIEEIVASYLHKIRMGYTLDVTLQDVLEEMERTIS